MNEVGFGLKYPCIVDEYEIPMRAFWRHAAITACTECVTTIRAILEAESGI